MDYQSLIKKLMLNYQHPDNILNKLMIFYGYICIILTDKKALKIEGILERRRT